MTERVRTTLEAQWEKLKKPLEGWVWPAPTESGHVEPSTLKKQHARTFKMLEERAIRNEIAPTRPFVLYSLRHRFLTRLGASGCDVWTLARIAGHSSIALSARYVHPSEDSVLKAMGQLQPATSEESTQAIPILPPSTSVAEIVATTEPDGVA